MKNLAKIQSRPYKRSDLKSNSNLINTLFEEGKRQVMWEKNKGRQQVYVWKACGNIVKESGPNTKKIRDNIEPIHIDESKNT